jgi:Spy/CpxP family protein refolding chaperone
MRKAVIILMFCLATVPAFAQTAATKSAPPPSIDEVLKAFRADMQATRADILAKNLTLSAEQAAKFWPMFDAYQKEQNVIMDAQLKAIQQFVDHFDTLDDATALSLVNANFDRDAKMAGLRKKWLGEFQKVLPPKVAVRAMQIDRQLSLAMQFEIASRIPLAH